MKKINIMKKLILAILCTFPLAAVSQQVEKIFSVEGKEMYYLIYTPEGYENNTESWPLVIFLHGSGERGKDYELLKVHGPPKNAQNPEMHDLPFLILSPQLSADARGWHPDHLSSLLDEVIKDYRVDADRIYLTGLSMGGYGTWAWAFQEPDRFAALAPICGRGDPYQVEKIKDIPVWVFHGARDQVVKIEESQKMVNALDKIDGDVRFTIYPTLGHVSWDEAYDSGILYEWFMKQSR
jgi:predicted peptidase